jgi:hypothetical protein
LPKAFRGSKLQSKDDRLIFLRKVLGTSSQCFAAAVRSAGGKFQVQDRNIKSRTALVIALHEFRVNASTAAR